MTFSQTERAELCQLLDDVGPTAPTLCAGWTTHDLASHLWIRETDPLGAPGMVAKPLGAPDVVAKPLAAVTEHRMAQTKERWSYPELVDRVRQGPARFSIFAIPGVDEAANTLELFTHHEDVRRAGEAMMPHRELPAETEDWIWRRLALLARALFRRSEIGVNLEREVPDGLTEPQPIRARPGSQTVTLVGQPSEILLYAYGRGAHSQVREIGEPAAVRQLAESALGV